MVVTKHKCKCWNIDIDALSKTYEQRNSLRSTGRIFGISHLTVFSLLKKTCSLANFKSTIELPQRKQLDYFRS